jgi:hypothetical protein
MWVALTHGYGLPLACFGVDLYLCRDPSWNTFRLGEEEGPFIILIDQDPR